VAGGLKDFDRFGWALSAGDFNNDGSSDLAVGVPGEAIGAIAEAGAVNVLYGAAGGLTGAGSQLFGQDTGGVAGTAERSDQFGSALAAGDFNNDDFADGQVGETVVIEVGLQAPRCRRRRRAGVRGSTGRRPHHGRQGKDKDHRQAPHRYHLHRAVTNGPARLTELQHSSRSGIGNLGGPGP
jgi:hypothetical protein